MTRPCYCCGARDPGDEEHCRYCNGYVGAVNKRLNDEAPLSGPRFCLRCHSAHGTHSVLFATSAKLRCETGRTNTGSAESNGSNSSS